MTPTIPKDTFQLIGINKLVCIDTETTGLDVVKDRIIQIAYQIYENSPIDSEFILTRSVKMYLNPEGVPINPEAEAVHKITAEMVKDTKTFRMVAKEIYSDLSNSALLGFNIHGFDIQILNEEFARAGIDFPEYNQPILDAGVLFKKKEERTLSAAMTFYCNRELEGAHDALVDVQGTFEIFSKQLQRYPDLPREINELSRYTRFNDNVDLAGKLVYDKEGRICYNIGKAKGTPVIDDPGFGEWMLQKDFPNDTKRKIRMILNTLNIEMF